MEGVTSIYLFDRTGVEIPDEAGELLPGWRRSVWELRRNENSRKECLCAGLLYAYAMRQNGLSADAEVVMLPQGKPVLAGNSDHFFSLSHSGRYVICALSSASVGVDVQQIRSVNLSIARRFHPLEQKWLSSQPEGEREQCFFRIWTRKEAWVKAVSRDRVLTLDECDVIHDISGWHFRDYVLPGGYHASVCAAEKAEPEALIPVQREELLDTES